MKFISFIFNQKDCIGIISKDNKSIININDVLSSNFINMIDFITNSTSSQFEKLKTIFDSNTENNIPLCNVKICSPIKKPLHDIICIGVNYKAHAEESKNALGIKKTGSTDKCVYFSKRATEIIGHEDHVKGRFDLDEFLDYEVELAVIIGKSGTNIPKESAEDYIFGYSVFNDFTSRRIQREHLQWLRGKSFDTYSSMGPCILHKSNLPFPIEIDISSKVNGEIRQSSNTSLLLTDIPSIISEFSNGITLEPGDIIITGTPAGVAMGFDPPKYLKKGDIVECMIPEIGSLKNTIS